MKYAKDLATVCLFVIVIACLGFADEKKTKEDSISGTWECIAHHGGEEDIPFTMKLEQQNETVTGSIATADGELAVKSGTYKGHTLELQLETQDASYHVTGKLDGDHFKGHWSKEGDGMEGDWEGKKSAPAKPSGQ